MNKRFKLLTLIGVFLAFVIGGATLIVYSQKQNENRQQNNQKDDDSAKIRKQIDENGDPISDFIRPESANPQERAMRQTRNKKYNSDHAKLINKRFPTLDQSTSPLSISSSIATIPEAPIPTKSEVVVIGLVTSANAFVSEDKTNVFSEFDFQIGKVLKNVTNQEIQEKKKITLNRFGGKVRFPSGLIIYRGIDDLYMPKISKEYLMFLKYINESQTYEIITGYKLDNGKVESLDGVSRVGNPSNPYRANLRFNGMDAGQFISIVTNNTSDRIKRR